jgi:hypothetical protein
MGHVNRNSRIYVNVDLWMDMFGQENFVKKGGRMFCTLFWYKILRNKEIDLGKKTFFPEDF